MKIRHGAFLLLSCLIFSLSAGAHAQSSPSTYKGYACKKDCSGHRAGYAWAQKKGITNASDCRGRSKSFVEGCLSYVAERTASSTPQ